MALTATMVVNRGLMVVAAVFGIASITIGDADKSPIYFLLAYVLWRLK